MARPKTNPLTQRELEIMHVFWSESELEPTAAHVREKLAAQGRDLAITTVATLLSILVKKGYLRQTGPTRPHGYRALHTKEAVSGTILEDLVDRMFGGSATALLKCLSAQKELTKRERARLEKFLRELEE